MELSSQLVLHINEFLFGGKSVAKNSPARPLVSGHGEKISSVNLMINSSSERNEIKLKHNETAKHLKQSLVNTSTS